MQQVTKTWLTNKYKKGYAIVARNSTQRLIWQDTKEKRDDLWQIIEIFMFCDDTFIFKKKI